MTRYTAGANFERKVKADLVGSLPSFKMLWTYPGPIPAESEMARAERPLAAIHGFGLSQIGRFYNRNHATVRYGIARAMGMRPIKSGKGREVISGYLRMARSGEQ